MVAKYLTEVGTTGQWPRGADLYYILAGVLWTQSQRIHSSHKFLVGNHSGCYFWTYSKYPLGIYGVPLPNLINSSYINIKFDQEHLKHSFVFQQQSHLWTPLLALIYLILSYVSALVLIKFWFLCCCGITNLANILCRIHLSELLKNLLI